jgi:hypothetical protein
MFKRMTLVTGFLCMMLVAGTALAGTAFQFGGGLALPTGDLGDAWNTGLGLDATALFEMGPTFSLGGSIGYHSFGIDDDLLNEAAGIDISWNGGKLKAISFCGEVRAHTGAVDATRMWAAAGGGFYSLTLDDLSGSYQGATEIAWQNVEGETKFGGYAGAGFALPMGPTMAVGLEGKYHVIFDEFGEGANSDTISFFEVKLAAMFSM